MSVWIADSGAGPVTVHARCTGTGAGAATAILDLFERPDTGKYTLVGTNPSAVQALDKQVPGTTDLTLALRVYALSPTGAATTATYLRVLQGGQILPSRDDNGEVENGDGPYHEIRLSPDTANDTLTFYSFDVSFL